MAKVVRIHRHDGFECAGSGKPPSELVPREQVEVYVVDRGYLIESLCRRDPRLRAGYGVETLFGWSVRLPGPTWVQVDTRRDARRLLAGLELSGRTA